MRFESPWVLLLLLAVPVMLWLRRGTPRTGTIRFSSTAAALAAGRSLRVRLAGMPVLLRVLALVCLVAALARPQTGREEVRDVAEGIAIEMVLDRSGSMAAEMEVAGTRMTRLDAVKRVFREFVLGNGKNLAGRPDDLIGMVAFARYPDTVCPLTLAHGTLPLFLDSVKLVQSRAEDGTAIGDAIALAAARLKTAEETLDRQRAAGETVYDIRSRVIILLSDGENNAGRRDPLQAAELAADWGIRIYTIGIGGGEAVTSVRTAFGVYKIPVGRGVDRRTLEAVAEKTGGFFRLAEDEASLREIYAEIDRMEKTEIESVRFVDYHEAFTGFALAGLLLVVLETALACTVLRRTP